MTIGQQQRAVGTFATRQDAETALYELRASGFSMDRVSIVGREVDEISTGGKQIASDTQAEQGAATGAVAGGTLGGLTGLLVGLGALAIPGVGPLVVGGAAGTALATALSGGAIGAASGGLLGGLAGLGIPEDRARLYSDRVSRGEYLVMVDGTADEIRRAEQILGQRGIQDWGIFAHQSDADRQETFPAGTLYPEGMPNEADRTTYPEGGVGQQEAFPAGTLYPEGKPYGDQSPGRHLR
jgi:hypothetical protein